MGIAGNYGLKESDLLHAAERGASLWLYNTNFKHVTRALKQILPGQRDQHVIAALGIVAYTGGMVRRAAENVLRSLQIEQLDLLLLPWLGRASFLTAGIQDTLARLKAEGPAAAQQSRAWPMAGCITNAVEGKVRCSAVRASSASRSASFSSVPSAMFAKPLPARRTAVRSTSLPSAKLESDSRQLLSPSGLSSVAQSTTVTNMLWSNAATPTLAPR